MQFPNGWPKPHYSDVIMCAMASKIAGVSIVYSTLCSDEDQRKHQSPASLAFVRGIHRWPVNSPHKGSVTQKMFPFDDVIMRLVNSEAILEWIWIIIDNNVHQGIAYHATVVWWRIMHDLISKSIKPDIVLSYFRFSINAPTCFDSVYACWR